MTDINNNILWLIQSTSTTINLEDEAFFAKQVNYIDFGIIPFTDTMTNLDKIYSYYMDFPNTKFIVRGGTKILNTIPNLNEKNNPVFYNDKQISSEEALKFYKKIKEGIFYDFQNFEQSYYQTLNLPLVNKDAIVANLSQAKQWKFDVPKFIKPSSDRKFFNGQIVEVGETIAQVIGRGMYHADTWTQDIIIADITKLKKEFRFFVVNKKVITGSQCYENHKLNPQKLNDTEEHINAFSIAQQLSNIFQPSEIFTIDIALDINNEWKIVEYNCFNCSGFYKSDLTKLQENIETFILEKHKLSPLNKLKL